MHYTPEATSHEAFVTRVKDLMDARGLSVQKLALALNENEGTTKNMLYRGTSCNRERLVALAGALGSTVEYLATGVGEPDQTSESVTLIVRSLRELAYEKGLLREKPDFASEGTFLRTFPLPLQLLQRYGISPGNARAARVDTDAMEPYIKPDEIVVVDIADTTLTEGNFILTHHGSVIVRSVSPVSDLMSFNVANVRYSGMAFSPEELASGEARVPKVVGRVRFKISTTSL